MDPKQKLADLKARIKVLAFKAELSEEEGKELQVAMGAVESLQAQVDAQARTEAEEAARLAADEAAKADAKAVQDKLVADQAKLAEDQAKLEADRKALGRPVAPSTGAPGGVDSAVIRVSSPFDRMDTMDLALKYQILKAQGQQPSDKWYRALVERVGRMAKEEDTIGSKFGEPVKVSAIDWPALTPRANLDLGEVAGDQGEIKDPVTERGIKSLHNVATKASELVYTTQANAGDEWVPTLMNAQLWRTVRLNAAVLGQLEQFDMPSQPFEYPTESTDPVFYKVAESTNEAQLVIDAGPFVDSKPGTAKITFSAGKLGAISYWSEEQEEDGIIMAEPQFRDQYGIKFAHVLDEVLLSGDETTGTANISYGTGGSIGTSSRYLIIDGLRHEPLVTTTADGRDAGALTIDDFGATVALMGAAGKFGANPADLVWFMDTGVWHKARLLGEVLTQDKFGALATVFNGQIGALFGSPIVASEDYDITNTVGIIDGVTATNNTKGSFIAVNKRGVKVGWRRRPRIRVERLPFSEAVYIVASARLDIGFKSAGMVAMSYNITI